MAHHEVASCDEFDTRLQILQDQLEHSSDLLLRHFRHGTDFYKPAPPLINIHQHRNGQRVITLHKNAMFLLPFSLYDFDSFDVIFGRLLQVMVHPMLWDHLSCLSVCNVGVLWPYGWIDQDAT